MKKITGVVIAVTIITVILFVMRIVEIGKPYDFSDAGECGESVVKAINV